MQGSVAADWTGAFIIPFSQAAWGLGERFLGETPPMAPTPNTGQQVNGHATGGFELTYTASSPSHKLYMGIGIENHCAPN